MSVVNRTELVIWASQCAERVLPLFERLQPHDQRPANAISAAKGWAAGVVTAQDALIASRAANMAARESESASAIAAARAAAHAAAAVKGLDEAKAAATYGRLAKASVPGVSFDEQIQLELAWQRGALPINQSTYLATD